MAIDQETQPDRITFSPSTAEEDMWMRNNYSGFDTVRVALSFSIPDEMEKVNAFRKAAEKMGFSIRYL